MVGDENLAPVGPYAASELGGVAVEILEDHWRPGGHTVPNAVVYPHQWLWDSCFCAVVWARLGRPERAVSELRAALSRQDPDGFVPHMIYRDRSGQAQQFWGRPDTSCITQPPMYGHALAEMARSGHRVPEDLIERAERGLWFLLRSRRGPGGGVHIIHPWESGCDDSPRWDSFCDQPWSPQAWYELKGELVAELTSADSGPWTESRFCVRSAAFEALVAFNARELSLLVDRRRASRLRDSAAEIADGLAGRWVEDLATWADVSISGAPAGTERTAEALLGSLVVGDAQQVNTALDAIGDGFASPYGVAGVHRDEPAFEPDRYWRGPVWPQVTYLLVLAARRQRRHSLATGLAEGLRAGATRSGFAEYWHPDTAEPLGAAPQSWTALAAIV